MGWFLTAIVIAMLVAFNVYVADGLIRMQNDVKQIHKLLINSASSSASASVVSKFEERKKKSSDKKNV